LFIPSFYNEFPISGYLFQLSTFNFQVLPGLSFIIHRLDNMKEPIYCFFFFFSSIKQHLAAENFVTSIFFIFYLFGDMGMSNLNDIFNPSVNRELKQNLELVEILQHV
jgi:hypothetical protein